MKNIFNFITISTIALLSLTACDKGQGKGEDAVQAARIEISLEKYCSEFGTFVNRAWEKTDKVALVNLDADKEVITGSPITAGASSSSFVFSLKNAAKGNNLFAMLPATAITVEGQNAKASIPTTQDGKVKPVYIGKGTFSGSAAVMSRIEMTPIWSTLYANVEKGNYSIVKATLTGKSGEKIAGDLTINISDYSASATATSVTVEFKDGLDCRNSSVIFPFLIAPVEFSAGYSIKYVMDDGSEIVFETSDKVECPMGGKVESAKAESSSAQLLFCGDNMIYLIDADLAAAQGYKNAILWEWDALSEKNTVGKGMIRLDDCKAVDNNSKILATSSQDYAVLVDMKTKKLLWYSNNSDNAHSAEILPNDRIVVACSDGGDCLQLFDIKSSNKVLFSTPLASAHGVVWNNKTQRLYAIGGKTMNVYKLADWDTAAPKLELEQSINTSGNVTGLHDLTYVDDNTLLLSGNKAALYNIKDASYTSLFHFSKSHSIKAVNYNVETGECWYTDATGSDRELTWSSNDIRYTDDVTTLGFKKNIWIGDLNMYKVRVFKW